MVDHWHPLTFDRSYRVTISHTKKPERGVLPVGLGPFAKERPQRPRDRRFSTALGRTCPGRAISRLLLANPLEYIFSWWIWDIVHQFFPFSWQWNIVYIFKTNQYDPTAREILDILRPEAKSILTFFVHNKCQFLSTSVAVHDKGCPARRTWSLTRPKHWSGSASKHIKTY